MACQKSLLLCYRIRVRSFISNRAAVLANRPISAQCSLYRQNSSSSGKETDDSSVIAEILSKNVVKTSNKRPSPYDITDLEELLSTNIRAPELAFSEAIKKSSPIVGKLNELLTKSDTIDFFGSPDPRVPRSKVPCSGCGALLHCQDEAIPGYMPSQRFTAIPTHKLPGEICQRCVLLKNHNVALNVAVKPEDYRLLLEQIRLVDALIVVVVDITDLPGSILSNIGDIVGTHRPLYLVGNKVDLLPKDATGYLKRAKEMLLTACKEAGLVTEHEIRHTCLVSAKTGYGIEELVTKLMLDWSRKGDVYVLGCTNVGKSTLFNALLSSDYCHSDARDFIGRATTSVWPGTTLKTLKFPIVNPVPWRLHVRAQRLLRRQRALVEEEKLRRHMFLETGDMQYASLIGHIGQTYRRSDERNDASGSGEPSPAVEMESSYSFDGNRVIGDDEEAGGKDALVRQMSGLGASFKDSHWCHDTPGVINPEQIINMLTTDELAVMLTDKMKIPRTFALTPGDVMFVSGLARLDYVQGPFEVLVTVISTLSLPVWIFKSADADGFYTSNIGSDKLGLPLGGYERTLRLPALCGKEFTVKGKGKEESGADIILSSLGWVSVAAGEGQEVKIRTYTPAGRGCDIRVPSLLPHAVTLRGRRLPNSQAFDHKRVLRPERVDYIGGRGNSGRGKIYRRLAAGEFDAESKEFDDYSAAKDDSDGVSNYPRSSGVDSDVRSNRGAAVVDSYKDHRDRAKYVDRRSRPRTRSVEDDGDENSKIRSSFGERRRSADGKNDLASRRRDRGEMKLDSDFGQTFSDRHRDGRLSDETVRDQPHTRSKFSRHPQNQEMDNTARGAGFASSRRNRNSVDSESDFQRYSQGRERSRILDKADGNTGSSEVRRSNSRTVSSTDSKYSRSYERRERTNSRRSGIDSEGSDRGNIRASSDAEFNRYTRNWDKSSYRRGKSVKFEN